MLVVEQSQCVACGLRLGVSKTQDLVVSEWKVEQYINSQDVKEFTTRKAFRRIRRETSVAYHRMGFNDRTQLPVAAY